MLWAGCTSDTMPMQLTIPMYELATPVTVTKGELCHALGVSDKTLRKRYLTNDFLRENGLTYSKFKFEKVLSPSLTTAFFRRYPEVRRYYLLRFLQNPGIPRNVLELLLTSR